MTRLTVPSGFNRLILDLGGCERVHHCTSSAGVGTCVNKPHALESDNPKARRQPRELAELEEKKEAEK